MSDPLIEFPDLNTPKLNVIYLLTTQLSDWYPILFYPKQRASEESWYSWYTTCNFARG